MTFGTSSATNLSVSRPGLPQARPRRGGTVRLHRKTLFGFALLLVLSRARPDRGLPVRAVLERQLPRPGPVRTFEGRALNEVAFPLGGIGTGTISLGGRGNLRDWEIFNRPGKGVHMPFSFFALYFEGAGRKLVRVLEGPHRAALHDRFRLQARLRARPAAHGEGPVQGRISVRRGRAFRQPGPARDPARGLQSRSSRSRRTIPASRPSSCATG
ncbi:MAG: GH116 family glycosyl-hydrolase [Ignavibacteriales bacterium]|nr:GH116 family glycosyl-hydrolase [Ignavibacteriales bacterium]